MFCSDICSICQSSYKKPVSITCRHVFCSSCIHMWYSTTNFTSMNNIRVASCPICRQYFYEKSIKPYKIIKNRRWESQYLYTKNPKIPSISHIPSRTRNQTHEKRWRETMKSLENICFFEYSSSDSPSSEKIIQFLKQINNNDWFIQKNGWGKSTLNENQRKAFVKLLSTKLIQWRKSGMIYANYFIFKHRKHLFNL
jgi:hypothetical protein